MRIIERPDIKGDFVPCVECSSMTRSHRLESPRYEEYEEVWEDELEEYQGRKKQEEEAEAEEEEVVIRYRLVDAQVCMCHKCWLVKQAKFADLVKIKYELWMDKTILHAAEIKKAVNTQIAYDFEDDTTIHALKNLAKQLKEAALDG